MSPEKSRHVIDHKLEEIVHLIQTGGDGIVELSPEEFSVIMGEAASRAYRDTTVTVSEATITHGVAIISGFLEDSGEKSNFYAEFTSRFTPGNRHTLTLHTADEAGVGDRFYYPNALLDRFIGSLCNQKGIAWSVDDKLLSVEFTEDNVCHVWLVANSGG